MEIFGTARYSVPATNVSGSRFLTTVNLMLDPEYRFSYYDSRVTGGRTGVTEDDKRCFVATAEDENCRYISVVLGATPEYRKDDPGRVHIHGSFEDTKTLLNMGFGTHDSTQILYKGQIVSQYSVVGGENDIVVGPNSDLRCIFPSDATSDQLISRVQLVSNPIQAPVKEGDLIAVMQVWYGNVCLGQTDLLAQNASNVNQTALDQNSQNGLFDAGASSTAMIVLIVIGALIVGLSLGLLIMRRINGVKRNKSARRRRRSH
jgi:D-alanyl-D-alanine carboxypeptidase